MSEVSVAQLRQQALDLIPTIPAPDRVEHLWRYTDPATLLPGEFPQPLAAVPEAPFTCKHSELSEADKEAGVKYMPLDVAIEKLPDLVFPYLGKILPENHSRYAALGCGLWHHGTFIFVPAGVRVETPLRHHVTVQGTGKIALRNLIVVGDNSEVTFVDEGRGGPSHVLTSAEVHLGDGARMIQTFVQRWDSKAVHIETRGSRLGRDADLTEIQLSLGGQITKLDSRVCLEGQGGHVSTLGVVFGDGNQHNDHHFVVDHMGTDTRSDLDCRVVLGDTARSAFTGMLRIREPALRSDARQTVKNLLLSPTARADSIPELEILTDDVSAAHAATAGPVDPEQVFYCQARGIPVPEARRLLTRGFMEAVIGRIPNWAIKEEARQILKDRLGE